MTDKILVLTTCESAEEADRIARRLVEQQVAACVNILAGGKSVYRWKGTVESAEEVLLVIKTSRALFDDVRREIESLHSYELPECIALPVVDGSSRYLDWLEQGLKQNPPRPR